jgi:hypothetical protein
MYVLFLKEILFMYHKLIIKTAVLISAIIALIFALSAFEYVIVLPMWAAYLALVSSIIVLLAFGTALIMHGGYGGYICCHSHSSSNPCACGKENCNCNK